MPITNCKGCGKEIKPRAKYCQDGCYRKKEQRDGRARVAKYSPARRRACVLVQTARINGTLVPQDCEVCGHRSHVVAHHDDYAAPLDVRWLCRSHHKIHHNQFGPGRNA